MKKKKSATIKTKSANKKPSPKTSYPSGILKKVWEVRDGKKNGIKREYSENGTLSSATNYKNDVMHGLNNTYHPDGSLWRKKTYKNGKLVAKMEFDRDGRVVSR